MTIKVKVTKRFTDKFNRRVSYQPGMVVTFDKERADNLIRRGLAVEVEVDTKAQAEAAAKAKAEAEAKAKAKAEAKKESK